MKLRHFMVLMALAVASEAQDVKRMDELVAVHASSGRFMGSVLVAKGGDVVFEKSYGSANLEWDIPNSPTTKFRLGSVTKQFTAAAILLLEERGRLGVDDLLSKHLPGTPAAWEKITLFHLLTHTAGLANFTAQPEFRTWKLSPSTPDKTLERLRDLPLEFEPGERHKYSNSGYQLLGHVIERVSGQSYAAFLEENIFKPLGMADSGYDSHAAVIARRATGYVAGPKGMSNAEYIDMTIPFAAGALYSTTRDLLRWNVGLFGGKLLSAASLEKMTTPHKDGYAFGLAVTTPRGRKAISHRGGIDGFNTHLIYYPDEKVTVVVLANLNGPVAAQLSPQLGAVMFGETVKLPNERQAIDVPPAKLKEYEGIYQLNPRVTNTIRLVDGQLTTQLTGQRALPIFAETEDKFFLKVVDAQLDFGRDEQGRVTHLEMHQNGRTQKVPRIGNLGDPAASAK